MPIVTQKWGETFLWDEKPDGLLYHILMSKFVLMLHFARLFFYKKRLLFCVVIPYNESMR